MLKRISSTILTAMLLGFSVFCLLESQASQPNQNDILAVESKQKLKQLTEREQKLKAFLAEAQQQRANHPMVGHVMKTITIKTEQLTDASGLTYIGGKVPAVELAPYLRQMIGVLGSEQFALYRANQARRDHQSFHVTVVNPFELKAVKQPIKTEQMFTVTLIGLGMAQEPKTETAVTPATAYFVVAESADIQHFRQQLGLPAKDLHVTLGFKPNDVFGVSKGRDSLVTLTADK